MEKIFQDIAVIKKDIEYIREFIQDDRHKFEKHIDEAEGYRQRVNGLEVLRHHIAKQEVNLENHIIADRWTFGVSFSLLIGILAIVCKIAFKG